MVVQLLSPLSVVLDALIFLSAGFSALNAYGAHPASCISNLPATALLRVLRGAEAGQGAATARLQAATDRTIITPACLLTYLPACLLVFNLPPAPAPMPLSAGVNVGPLMASVGGIGVAVGLATQSVATNVVSALSLFASRPFVVGDRVQLMKGGAVVVEGKVEHIEPMRTVLRDPEGNPSEWDTACAGLRRHAPIRWQLRGLACAALVCVLCCAVLCCAVLRCAVHGGQGGQQRRASVLCHIHPP